MLNKLAKKIHKNAVDKGFWDKPLEIGTLLMLVVSELGEALEAHREDKKCTVILKAVSEWKEEGFNISFERGIKDTFEDELADSIIRILDICAANKIDIQKHVELKMRYNKIRKKLHGKKY